MRRFLVAFLRSSNSNEGDAGTVGFTLCMAAGVAGLLFLCHQRVSEQRRRHGQQQIGVPMLYRTPQGRAYPWIGHGLTFWRHTPWDLLMAWHRNTNNNPDGSDNTNNSTTGSENSSRPIVCFPLLGTTMFSVASPSLCQAILQSRVAHVHKDIQVTMKPFLSILGTGMVTSEGPQWLRQRMQLSHSLRNDILERIPSHTLAAVQRLCVVLDKAAATASDAASVVPMGSLLRHLTLQVISGAFLSLSAGESDAHFARLYLPIVDESNRRVWHPYRTYNVLSLDFWRYQMNVFRLNSYVCRLIRERWTLRRLEQDQEPQNNLGRVVEGIPAETSATAAACTAQRPWDILDRVLQFYEAHPKTSDSDYSSRKTMPRFLSPAVIRQVRDEMKTFMLAGHETSAAMMTWTLYELVCSQQPHQRPHMSSAAATTDSTKDKNITSCSWMDRVVAEADTVFLGAVDWGCSATAKDLPPLETLANLVLAEASLKESLRKYSVVPMVSRRVIQDLTLEEGPYLLPKGSTVMINIQALHLDPNIWPQPMRYDPTRFLLDHNNSSIKPDANSNATKADNGKSSDKSMANNGGSDPPRMNKTGMPIRPFTFLPFIAGPRNCLGQHLALLESKMVIALLTQRYTFHFCPDSGTSGNTKAARIDPEDWSDGKDPRHPFMVPLIPKKELLVIVTRKIVDSNLLHL